MDAVEPTLMHALVCLALVAAGAAGATAQTRPEPSLDLSVGYQVMHIPGQTYPLGISLEMSGALTSAVRIVAEAGVSIARRTISSHGAGTLTTMAAVLASPRGLAARWSTGNCSGGRADAGGSLDGVRRAIH